MILFIQNVKTTDKFIEAESGLLISKSWGKMGSDCQWVRSCFLNIYLITYLAALGLSCGTQDIYCSISTLSKSMWNLVPWPAIEPGPSTVKLWRPNPWTARNSPKWARALCIVECPLYHCPHYTLESPGEAISDIWGLSLRLRYCNQPSWKTLAEYVRDILYFREVNSNHSSILSGETPWAEKAGGLQSMGS